MTLSADTAGEICAFLVKILESSGGAGFVVGISGGVDSALVAALCCRAVGPSRVHGFFLPSAVTLASDASDVAELAEKLSMKIETIPIGPIIDQYRRLPGFVETPYLLGNLMARIRMTLLYYQANLTSSLVCGTSNRTEYILGYCTKHGDNAADIQPVIHLLKTEIWDLARSLGVPEPIVTRPPTAGLWSGQTDEGELGIPYRDIDTAIRTLDNKGWKAETETEKMVVSRNNRAHHKQVSAPSLSVI
jgi:NAD+ synthase